MVGSGNNTVRSRRTRRGNRIVGTLKTRLRREQSTRHIGDDVGNKERRHTTYPTLFKHGHTLVIHRHAAHARTHHTSTTSAVYLLQNLTREPRIL